MSYKEVNIIKMMKNNIKAFRLSFKSIKRLCGYFFYCPSFTINVVINRID